MSDTVGDSRYRTSLLLALIAFALMYYMSRGKEGMTNRMANKPSFEVASGTYNADYMKTYDAVSFSRRKYEYETFLLDKYLKQGRAFSSIKILDVGCGTGHHTAYLNKSDYHTVGLDVSKDAVEHCAKEYGKPEWFLQGDAMNPSIFKSGEFTHVLCLNYTIYYMSNVETFLRNCYDWLRANRGVMFLHLVDDIEKNYLETDGWVKLSNGAKYNSTIDVIDNVLSMDEKIKYPSGRVIMNRHTMHGVGDSQRIIKIARRAGFYVHDKHKVKARGFNHHWIYILKK